MKLDKFDYFFTQLMYDAARSSRSTRQLDSLCEMYRKYVQTNDLKYMYMFHDILENVTMRTAPRQHRRRTVMTFRMQQEDRDRRERQRDREMAEMKQMMMTMMNALAEQSEKSKVADVNVASSREMREMSKGIKKLEKVAMQGQDLSSIEFKDLPDWMRDQFTMGMKRFASSAVTFPFKVTRDVLTFTFVKAPAAMLSKGLVVAEVGMGLYVIAITISGTVTLYVNYKDEVDSILPYITTPAHYFVISPVTSTFHFLNETSGLNAYLAVVGDKLGGLVDYLPSQQAIATAKTLGNLGMFLGQGAMQIGGRVMSLWS